MMAGNLQVRMLFSIGYGAGLRVSEVVRLQVRHIDSSLGVIRVEQGKGKKDRQVMLCPRRSSCYASGGRCARTSMMPAYQLALLWHFGYYGFCEEHLTVRAS